MNTERVETVRASIAYPLLIRGEIIGHSPSHTS